MMRGNCKVAGITELVMSAKLMSDLDGSPKETLTPKEECERRLYKGPEGQIWMPRANVWACIVAGGIFHKLGRKTVTTRDTSLVPAALTMHGEGFDIESKDGWRAHTYIAVNQSTKGSVLTHRPLFDDWSFAFEFELDEGFLPAKLFRNICDDAFLRIGLGSGRPQCKRPFGKSKIVHWELEKVNGKE